MRYPKSLKRLSKEIKESFESEAEITISSTMKLPYLEAIINETLRIHHPTPINLPRVLPPQGQKLDDDWIPEGVSTLRFHALIIHTCSRTIGQSTNL